MLTKNKIVTALVLSSMNNHAIAAYYQSDSDLLNNQSTTGYLEGYQEVVDYSGSMCREEKTGDEGEETWETPDLERLNEMDGMGGHEDSAHLVFQLHGANAATEAASTLFVRKPNETVWFRLGGIAEDATFYDVRTGNVVREGDYALLKEKLSGVSSLKLSVIAPYENAQTERGTLAGYNVEQLKMVLSEVTSLLKNVAPSVSGLHIDILSSGEAAPNADHPDSIHTQLAKLLSEPFAKQNIRLTVGYKLERVSGADEKEVLVDGKWNRNPGELQENKSNGKSLEWDYESGSFKSSGKGGGEHYVPELTEKTKSEISKTKDEEKALYNSDIHGVNESLRGDLKNIVGQIERGLIEHNIKVSDVNEYKVRFVGNDENARVELTHRITGKVTEIAIDTESLSSPGTLELLGKDVEARSGSLSIDIIEGAGHVNTLLGLQGTLTGVANMFRLISAGKIGEAVSDGVITGVTTADISKGLLVNVLKSGGKDVEWAENLSRTALRSLAEVAGSENLMKFADSMALDIPLVGVGIGAWMVSEDVKRIQKAISDGSSADEIAGIVDSVIDSLTTLGSVAETVLDEVFPPAGAVVTAVDTVLQAIRMFTDDFIGEVAKAEQTLEQYEQHVNTLQRFEAFWKGIGNSIEKTADELWQDFTFQGLAKEEHLEKQVNSQLETLAIYDKDSVDGREVKYHGQPLMPEQGNGRVLNLNIPQVQVSRFELGHDGTAKMAFRRPDYHVDAYGDSAAVDKSFGLTTTSVTHTENVDTLFLPAVRKYRLGKVSATAGAPPAINDYLIGSLERVGAGSVAGPLGWLYGLFSSGIKLIHDAIDGDFNKETQKHLDHISFHWSRNPDTDITILGNDKDNVFVAQNSDIAVNIPKHGSIGFNEAIALYNTEVADKNGRVDSASLQEWFGNYTSYLRVERGRVVASENAPEFIESGARYNIDMGGGKNTLIFDNFKSANYVLNAKNSNNLLSFSRLKSGVDVSLSEGDLIKKTKVVMAIGPNHWDQKNDYFYFDDGSLALYDNDKKEFLFTKDNAKDHFSTVDWPSGKIVSAIVPAWGTPSYYHYFWSDGSYSDFNINTKKFEAHYTDTGNFKAWRWPEGKTLKSYIPYPDIDADQYVYFWTDGTASLFNSSNRVFSLQNVNAGDILNYQPRFLGDVPSASKRSGADVDREFDLFWDDGRYDKLGYYNSRLTLYSMTLEDDFPGGQEWPHVKGRDIKIVVGDGKETKLSVTQLSNSVSHIIGTKYADTLTGNNNDNLLQGGGAKTGYNTLKGNNGSNTYVFDVTLYAERDSGEEVVVIDNYSTDGKTDLLLLKGIFGKDVTTEKKDQHLLIKVKIPDSDKSLNVRVKDYFNGPAYQHLVIRSEKDNVNRALDESGKQKNVFSVRNSSEVIEFNIGNNFIPVVDGVKYIEINNKHEPSEKSHVDIVDLTRSNPGDFISADTRGDSLVLSFVEKKFEVKNFKAYDGTNKLLYFKLTNGVSLSVMPEGHQWVVDTAKVLDMLNLEQLRLKEDDKLVFITPNSPFELRKNEEQNGLFPWAGDAVTPWIGPLEALPANSIVINKQRSGMAVLDKRGDMVSLSLDESYWANARKWGHSVGDEWMQPEIDVDKLAAKGLRKLSLPGSFAELPKGQPWGNDHPYLLVSGYSGEPGVILFGRSGYNEPVAAGQYAISGGDGVVFYPKYEGSGKFKLTNFMVDYDKYSAFHGMSYPLPEQALLSLTTQYDGQNITIPRLEKGRVSATGANQDITIAAGDGHVTTGPHSVIRALSDKSKVVVSYIGNVAAKLGVTVSLKSGTGSQADAEGDHYEGIYGVQGSSFNDVLEGDDNDNYLNGGAGDDVLIIHGGNDILVGGTGFNTYRISDDAWGVKLIDSLDTSKSTDTLELKNWSASEIGVSRLDNDLVLSLRNRWLDKDLTIVLKELFKSGAGYDLSLTTRNSSTGTAQLINAINKLAITDRNITMDKLLEQ
ncbi:TPA: hypothetical protein RQK66_002263 [Vibrio vulnificus]|nr:hypothetical protein [Vibrio vulnificus]HDY8158672.1 hypothetical protein [Vibrio vulnificus]